MIGFGSRVGRVGVVGAVLARGDQRVLSENAHTVLAANGDESYCLR